MFIFRPKASNFNWESEQFLTSYECQYMCNHIVECVVEQKLGFKCKLGLKICSKFFALVRNKPFK